MLPVLNIASSISLPESSGGSQSPVTEGSAANGLLQSEFVSIFQSLTSSLESVTDEQELTALLDSVSSNSGESLPQDILELILQGDAEGLLESGQAENPEQFTGDELISYLMANAGPAATPALRKSDLKDGIDQLISQLKGLPPGQRTEHTAQVIDALAEFSQSMFPIVAKGNRDGVDVDAQTAESELALAPLTAAVQDVSSAESVLTDTGMKTAAELGAAVLPAAMSSKTTTPDRKGDSLASSVNTLFATDEDADSDKANPTLTAQAERTRQAIPDKLPDGITLKPGMAFDSEALKPLQTTVTVPKDGESTTQTKNPEIPAPLTAELKMDGNSGDISKTQQINLREGMMRADALIPESALNERTITEAGLNTLRAPMLAARGAEAAIVPQALAEQLARPMKLDQAAQALAERIQTMVAGDLHRAFIRLDPPELGGLELRVQVQNDQAQVQIVSPSSQVREALEQNSARLREALAEQGLNLAEVDVSDQRAGSQRDQEGTDDGQSGPGDEGIAEFESDEAMKPTVSQVGLIDQYI